jgi:hypothetical protein
VARGDQKQHLEIQTQPALGNQTDANAMAVTLRPHGRSYRASRVNELSVWRTADQLLKQYPETASLVAAQRADAAYAAGQTFKFRLWGRVTHALMELLRQRSSADTVN